ncbi:MAG: transposase [candidate division Zixibacteria bacterium]|nr:transposase [candidate division Zixibacteria bacterium]
MTNIRRYFRSGNVYFLTHVTYKRRPILVFHFDDLWNAIQSVKNEYDFNILAWCVLPDHFHILVDPINSQTSGIMRRIKLSFSAKYRRSIANKSGRVWQYRFWDHQIRNQQDLNHHIDYIHYNPVKHALAKSPAEYKLSSFNEYQIKGYYPENWGGIETIDNDGQFGE